jgi:S1-C subfamily serine protease
MKIYNGYNQLVYTKNNPQSEIVAIYKVSNKYKSISIGQNADNSSGISFQNTATSGVYLMENYYKNTYSTAKSTAILTGIGLLEFTYEKPEVQVKYEGGSQYINGTRIIFEHQWIKISPQAQDYSKSQPASGTGFCISPNGIIVTNYHVIEGAKIIKVRGVNSDFNKTLKAKILISDKNNDLALIQIDDYGFTSLGTIPYTIKTGLAGVGESIFVLGYPLRATMGDEIKLTNGIISSRTGFQGDITSYQISAPVQPGNSGGPLFDSQGNLIGIINAKHAGAENASYAVKSSYLTGLIELLTSPPKLQTVNSLSGKTLIQQVEMVKKFVYIIETE